MLGKIIIATGIPGTGKSTVCREVVKLAQKQQQPVRVVNYGSIMVNLLSNRGEALHRDELRKSTLTFQQELQTQAAQLIAEQAQAAPGILIVDTHMSIKTPKGFLAGLPSDVLQLLKPDLLVLIEAESHEVLSRRSKDKTRKRDEALESGVAEEFFFSRLMAAACAVLTGASIKIVKNPAGQQLLAAKTFLETLSL